MMTPEKITTEILRVKMTLNVMRQAVEGLGRTVDALDVQLDRMAEDISPQAAPDPGPRDWIKEIASWTASPTNTSGKK